MLVLLPIYGIEDSQLILEFVKNYNWPSASRFTVLHVIGLTDSEEEAKQARTSAEALVAEVVAGLKRNAPNGEFRPQITTGNAAYEILEVARQLNAGMIVMGFRTKPSIREALAGSVSKAVVMQAPCSVAIVRPPAEPEQETECVPASEAASTFK